MKKKKDNNREEKLDRATREEEIKESEDRIKALKEASLRLKRPILLMHQGSYNRYSVANLSKYLQGDSEEEVDWKSEDEGEILDDMRFVAHSRQLTKEVEELKELVNALSRDVNALKENLYNEVTRFSSHDTKQLIPVEIYLSSDDPETIYGVYQAVLNYLEFAGFDKLTEFPDEQGSWFKRIIARSIGAIPKEEVTDRLREAEYIIEVNGVLKPQSEVDKNQSEALANIMNSVKDIGTVAIRIGSLLIVKLTNPHGEVSLQVRTLTIKELHILNKKPELLRQPDQILSALSKEITDTKEITDSNNDKLLPN